MRSLVAFGLLMFASGVSAAELPNMKFGEVREIAPGVFFRYSSISPTDPNVFGGSNNIWVVFEDYVVVIDANFPKEAGDVLDAVRKTTKKPVRYVLDTHHHGDHAWGNAVWVKAGATIVSSRNCAKVMKQSGEKEFLAAGKGPNARKDVAASTYKGPSLIFDDKLVLDDGKQRIEFLHLGHSHTIGDAVAWLPRLGILCTGDACVNGPYNYMGQSDSASWICSLEKMQALDVKIVCPGHGSIQGKDLLAKQKRYFVELRAQVKKGIDSGKEIADILKDINMPWYKEWTTVKPAEDNVKHVYNEFMGLVSPWDFEYDLGILAGPSPTKDAPGWKKPTRIVVPAGLLPGQLGQIKRAAPEVEFLPARTPEEAAKLAKEADAVIGYSTPEIAKGGKKLRWIHLLQPGGNELQKNLDGTAITLTDGRRVQAPAVADQTFALLLALTRNVLGKEKTPPVELKGKTMLIVGLGGTGEQIARRANVFGMRVFAVDDRTLEKPDGVHRLDKLDRLQDLLKSADVVVLATPLEDRNRKLIGAKQLQAMKKSAFLVNAAHSGLIDLDALASALSAGELRGAALDITDLENPPKALTKLSNCVKISHRGVSSPDTSAREWRLLRENIRRFAVGEPLLGVVPGNRK